MTWAATASISSSCGQGGEERLGVLVADASGHGIAAALLTAETRAYLRALALTCADLGTLLTLSNQRLASDLVTGPLRDPLAPAT